MCPFYNAQLFEITGAAKGVFTHSQSSCHIAKVVLTIRHDSRQITIASDARPFHTSRGFLHWRFAYAGPTVRAAPPSWGRHPQTFTKTEVSRLARHVRFTLRCRHRQPAPACPFGAITEVPAVIRIRSQLDARHQFIVAATNLINSGSSNVLAVMSAPASTISA